MPDQPRVLCTRRLPPNVEARLARDYDATLNPEDRIRSEDGLVADSEGMDGILCAGGDPLNAGAVARLPGSVRIITTYSVGYEHVAVEAAKARGIVVTNTPDVLNDATADVAMLCLLGAARRGAEGDRMVRAGGMGGLVLHHAARRARDGQAPGDLRDGPDRTRGGAARTRLRHGDPLLQPGAASRRRSKPARSGTIPRNRCSRRATSCPSTRLRPRRRAAS